MSSDNTYELFLKSRGLIYRYCNKFAVKGYTIDDIMQEAYFPFLLALTDYNKSNKECKFSTYLVKRLSWYFIRLMRNNKNGDDLCILDAPIKEDTEHTKADILEDERTIDIYDNLIDDIDKSDLFGEAYRILEDYKAKTGIETDFYKIIDYRYRHNMTYKQIGENLGIKQEVANRLNKKAKSILRNSKDTKFSEYRNNCILSSYGIAGKGFFDNTGLSSVEYTVNKIIEKERRQNDK